jgi:hypothetical protein
MLVEKLNKTAPVNRDPDELDLPLRDSQSHQERCSSCFESMMRQWNFQQQAVFAERAIDSTLEKLNPDLHPSCFDDAGSKVFRRLLTGGV